MIAPTSFFSDYGGHIRILEETRALQERGHRVAIVTYHKGNNVPGLDIRRTARLPWHADYEVGSSRHKIAFDVYLAAQSLLEEKQGITKIRGKWYQWNGRWVMPIFHPAYLLTTAGLQLRF